MATTIVLNDSAPKYGDHISFTYTTDETYTGVKVTFTHAAGKSQSSVEYHPQPGTYDKQVGAYAPNWPEGPASGLAEVVKQVRKKRVVLASVAFEVAG